MRRTPLVLAAAAAGGYAVSRRRREPGSWPELHARTVGVPADDGTVLHAEVSGPHDASGTVVLAHGYVLSNRLWDQQVAALIEARPDLRVITYDQRGHGQSSRAPRDSATIDQLGRDLAAVLDQLATGPVVLVGHSMGGMTIMSYVEQHPDQVGTRVVGAGLVATSSGGLADLTFGLPTRASDRLKVVIPAGMEQARRWEDAGRKPLPQPFLRPVLFGRAARPADVRRTFEVLSACSAHTVADFFETFTAHDRLAALAALSDVPVSILIGSADRLCPLPMSRAMADALPHARLRVYPGAGHMLQLERAAEVSAELVSLASAIPAERLASV
ncbi:MAG: alpha/beta hydrolase fold protein [Frankiales bacterium]|nr:alpha/beta hydrolase fold protein [Frankiales bacterium]